MNVEVKVPTVGESITSGILSTWHKKDGEAVNAGDVLFTLETDKVSTEVTAPESGVLRTQAAEGDEVKIDQVVALIEPGGAAPAEAPAEQAKPEPAAKAPPPEPTKAPVEAPPAPPAAPTPSPRSAKEGRGPRREAEDCCPRRSSNLAQEAHSAPPQDCRAARHGSTHRGDPHDFQRV